MSNYKGNDEDGYGNPPVSNQFNGKPGPGRPKGSKSLEGALRKAFSKKIPRVDKNGKRSLVEAPEALAERALELGLKGNLQANIEARKLADKYGPQVVTVKYDLSQLSDAGLYLYGLIAKKVQVPENGEEPDFTVEEELFFTRLEKLVEEEHARFKGLPLLDPPMDDHADAD